MGMTSNHTHVDGKGGTCHGFAAVNLEFFGNAEEIKKHLSVFLDELRNSPKADGKEKIYTHGEKEVLAIEKIKEQGIAVDVKTVYEMKQMSDYLGMDFEKYFGKIELDKEYHNFY